MNMRKIIAMLAAVLMLCAAIPVAAFGIDFEDGTANGWQSDCGVEVVDLDGSKVLKWDASGAAWANMYNYCNLSANTEYVLTMKVKADRDTNMNFKVLKGDWSATTYQTTFDVTTEWQEISVQFNSGEGSFVMLSSNADLGAGATYYVDDFSIEVYVAPAVPGVIINGDFETGDFNGWEHHQSTTISTDAHSGSYAANVKGAGNWNGMLNQDIPVEAGKPYEISLWVKTIANGANIQIQDGPAGTKVNLASQWFTATEWTNIVWEVIPTTDVICINFCGGGNGIAEDVLVDDITVTELKAPSFDGYITNGDFEMGEPVAWENVWGSCQVSMVDGRNGGYAMQVNAGQWNIVRQKVAVQPNTNYVVKAYGKNASNMTLLVKDGNDGGNIAQAGFSSSEDFKATSLEFNSGDWSEVYICFMGNVAGSTVIVDDVMMFEKVEASNDGYIINGTFETGDIAPWDNLWGSCPKAEVVKGGMDSAFAVEIVSGQWKHVRQTNIAVEANTDYKITAWVKNAAGMSLLVKDGGDSTDIVNAGIEAGEEWTEFVITFNTGDYTSIIFSLMGNNAEAAYGTFDNIVMEKVVACDEHNYELTDGTFPTCETEGSAIYTCSICGDVKTETLPAYHNGGMEYNPAKEAIDCANPGNIENYYCPGCNEYFADAYAQEIINPWYIQITVDCVKPEGLADCAGWTCETCGNENFGAGEHDVVVCQGGTCSKCNAEIEGVGCQNYDTPACQDGVCYYCGGFVAGFGHENGAWAACCDGECAYGCGLIYPATEDHVDADADDYCDNCWNHLACIDADADGFCDVCWSEMPVAEIVYGDADGDGEITALDVLVLQQYFAGYEVTLNEVAADADGDGEITALDVLVLQQFFAGYEVTLGPV